RIVVEVHAEHVLSSVVMTFYERFLAHRNEFAFGIGGSTAFGEPFNGRWPENIDFTPAAAFYVGLVILVFLNRYPACKSLVVGDGSELIFGPYFRIFCLEY